MGYQLDVGTFHGGGLQSFVASGAQVEDIAAGVPPLGNVRIFGGPNEDVVWEQEWGMGLALTVLGDANGDGLDEVLLSIQSGDPPYFESPFTTEREVTLEDASVRLDPSLSDGLGWAFVDGAPFGFGGSLLYFGVSSLWSLDLYTGAATELWPLSGSPFLAGIQPIDAARLEYTLFNNENRMAVGVLPTSFVPTDASLSENAIWLAPNVVEGSVGAPDPFHVVYWGSASGDNYLRLYNTPDNAGMHPVATWNLPNRLPRQISMMDLNDDGTQDLLISEAHTESRGAVGVYLGPFPEGDADLEPDFVFTLDSPNLGGFGWQMKGADADGDGLIELAVSAPFNENRAGAVFIFEDVLSAWRDAQ